MAHTKLFLRDDARTKLLAGATALADALRSTLGPKSKCILIERKWGEPLVCNDGVTIAKEVDLEDSVENLGARMLREAAVRTGDVVGDGTTTSTILAHALFSEALRNLVAGASAIDLRRGIDCGVAAVVRELKAAARPVESHLERVQVATISAHNDPSIGEKVADAIERVGSEGVVSVEEAKGTETVVEVVDGMQFDRGYLSPYFVTDSGSMQATLEQPWILLHDGRITTTAALLPILEAVVKTGRPLLIVAEDVESDVLATLVVNKLRGMLACAAVKAPGFGEQRKAILADLAALTGATIVANELGVELDKLTAAELGSAKRVVVDRENTTLIGGGGQRAALDARRGELRRALALNPSTYDRERLEQRLAKLAGGVAVVRVGAPTEAEMRNRKEAFEDAIAATKAAIAEGIVAGGGAALLRAARAVAAEKGRSHGDEHTGLAVLERALEAPIRQIAANSGFDGGVVVDRLRGAPAERGFDAHTGEYVDLFRAGIVDPTKVVRVALENAASVAGTLLLVEGALTRVETADAQAPRELDAR